jgi:DICT domain-containing protein
MSRELQELSLYRLVAAEAKARNVPMRELGRKDVELRPAQAGFFDASVRAMQYWCRLNENLVLERHASGASVYAGFERLSRVKPVVKRYERLASEVERLVVFGEADVPLPFAARTVDVSGATLAREWFLVIDAPSYKTLLVARDQHGFGPTGPLAGRRFVGLSTHDADLVRTACTALERWLR